MTHTPTPWKVFVNKDGTRFVGVGAQDGGGILDSGYGVWSWDSPEGIANAEMVVRAVNSHHAMVDALKQAREAIWSGGDTLATITAIDLALVAAAPGLPSPPVEQAKKAVTDEVICEGCSEPLSGAHASDCPLEQAKTEWVG